MIANGVYLSSDLIFIKLPEMFYSNVFIGWGIIFVMTGIELHPTIIKIYSFFLKETAVDGSSNAQ